MPGPLLSPADRLDDWVAAGGGRGLDLARRLGPEGTIEELQASGLRGRGGGGFPTGRKWSGVLSADGANRYVVCNGAEGEPGTFKDRAILRANPYQVLEGLAVAAYVMDARGAYIALKASFERELARLREALAEMTEAGLAGDVPIEVVEGPDEYLFGEEKALLRVVEGNQPLPTLFPPYQHGLFATVQMGWNASEAPEGLPRGESNPTLVNNVETLANVAHVLREGADWFRARGTADSPGTICVTVVGDVRRPCVVEVDMGTPLAEVLENHGGGPREGRRFKAAFSGVANPVVLAADFATPLSYEAWAAKGTSLGAAGYMVFDDTACMVEVARLFSRFLYVESCGQCPPCKRGSGEITSRLEALESGQGDDRDIEEMGSWLVKVTDGNRCYLAVEEQAVISSILRAFPEEFAAHVEQDRCPYAERRQTIELPKIVDLEDGSVVYDQRQYRKQPDWTYLS